MNEKALLAQLKNPFPPEAIEWLPGSTTSDKSKCMAMAYADLRAYQERLDDVCGIDWMVKYVAWGDNRIMCELTILVGDALGRAEAITRASTGEMAAQDEKNNMGGTVAEAQAFKRAAAMFGLGRYLYTLPSVWVAYDAQRKRITDAGITELNGRYKAWYAKKLDTIATISQDTRSEPNPTTAHRNGAQKPTTPATEDNGPTDEEHDIISQWSSPTEAQSYAIMVGACANEHEARNSFKHVVDEHGGRFTTGNKHEVYLAWVRKVQGKLQAAKVAA